MKINVSGSPNYKYAKLKKIKMHLINSYFPQVSYWPFTDPVFKEVMSWSGAEIEAPSPFIKTKGTEATAATDDVLLRLCVFVCVCLLQVLHVFHSLCAALSPAGLLSHFFKCTCVQL